jgi:hypothetical protein
MQNFKQYLDDAELTYHTDTSWEYRYETPNICISFGQLEDGKNIIENFAVKRKSIWICLTPTDKQIKMMFAKLELTPYRNYQ